MSTDSSATMNVAFRVDSSPSIGVGHFMRCLALADALRPRGARCRFVCRHLAEHLMAMVVANGHELRMVEAPREPEPLDELPQARLLGTSQRQDAGASLDQLSDAQWDWIVVDHYGLDARWEAALRKAARNLMVIDDTADRSHDCDLLLDQNFYSNMQTRYAGKVPAACTLLLGPRFALLRDEFFQRRRNTAPRSGPVRRVLVFFGGADADNHTGRALEALASIGDRELKVDVVIGQRHAHREAIERACSERRYACHVQSSRMAELMAAADFSIGAGGSASWERMCVGLPALVACIADNQRQLIGDCAEKGLLIAADSIFGNPAALADRLRQAFVDERLRSSMSQAGMRLVDGRGVLRVPLAMGCTGLNIREATPEDSARLLSWRNHPSIRSASRRSEAIAPQEHERWLRSVLADPHRFLLIGLRNENPVGVVRFDARGREAEVSIYLVPGNTGTGAGSALLLRAEQWLCAKHPTITTLRAETLEGNEPSRRLFQGMGYQPSGDKFTKRLR